MSILVLYVLFGVVLGFLLAVALMYLKKSYSLPLDDDEIFMISIAAVAAWPGHILVGVIFAGMLFGTLLGKRGS